MAVRGPQQRVATACSVRSCARKRSGGVAGRDVADMRVGPDREAVAQGVDGGLAEGFDDEVLGRTVLAAQGDQGCQSPARFQMTAGDQAGLA